LQTLLHALGVDQRDAVKLAAAIADWRSPATWPLPQGAKAPQYRAAGAVFGPPNAPFRSVDELSMVLGMTPTLLALLRPHVSVYTESVPNPSASDPVVAQAVEDARAGGQPSLSFDEAAVVQITATAIVPDGGQFTRRAVIRIIAGDEFASTRGVFQILNWQSGPA
jgi:general secretion pathway protein K